MKKIVILLLVLFTLNAQNQKAEQIFLKMLNSIENTNSLKITFEKIERLEGGKMHKEKMSCKVQYSPKFKVYCYQHYPKKGAEVLYVAGQNNGKALVNPNGFPYTNLNLDPHGSVLMDKQHHSIFETGFKYLGNVLKYLYNKYKATSKNLIVYLGEGQWNGFDVYKIKLVHPNFRYVYYTVKQGEDLIKIARKKHLSEYMIMDINNLDDFYDVKPGQKIKIPVDYAKAALMYVDKKTYLPVRIVILDDKGVFEEYKYSKVVKNPTFTAKDFSEDNSEYGF